MLVCFETVVIMINEFFSVCFFLYRFINLYPIVTVNALSIVFLDNRMIL